MAPAAAAHERQHRLDHRHRAVDVGFELTAQVVDRGFLDQPFEAVARVVDENVDRADRGLDLGHRRERRFGVGDVEHPPERAPRRLRLERRHRLGAAQGADNAVPFGEGETGEFLAEAGTDAGDEKSKRCGCGHEKSPGGTCAGGHLHAGNAALIFTRSLRLGKS